MKWQLKNWYCSKLSNFFSEKNWLDFEFILNCLNAQAHITRSWTQFACWNLIITITLIGHECSIINHSKIKTLVCACVCIGPLIYNKIKDQQLTHFLMALLKNRIFLNISCYHAHIWWGLVSVPQVSSLSCLPASQWNNSLSLILVSWCTLLLNNKSYNTSPLRVARTLW